MNEKGNSWGTWFWIILFIMIMTSAIRHSYYRHAMYDDLYEDQLQQQQQEDYYQQQMEDELQRQYEQEQYEEMLREQQREAYEEELRHQQEEENGGQLEELQQQGEAQQYTSLSCQSGYINEYRCSENNIQQKYQYSGCSSTWVHNYHCLYGCENGKCVGSCYDTDGGKDYFVKGYIDYGDWKNYDECDNYNKDYLIEVYCNSSGNGQIEYYKCQYGCSDGACNQEPPAGTLTVSYVLDGDTFKLSTGETIRLIGLNAPESGQSCSSEATAKLKEFVFGKEVTLEQDVSDKDQYGRLLRYVYIDDTFVNLEMVRLGFAHKYEYGSNIKYSSRFEQAEDEAKQNEGCLWKTSQENYINDQCIYITNFHFNAAGDDNYNLNDEYVIFGNKCSYSIEMTGWTIKDETASHIYRIPSFTFQFGATFTLYTGIGTNTNSALYWGRTSGDYAAIWNNGGDTLFLRDSNGNLVLSKSY